MIYRTNRAEAEAYYALCRRADRLGIPTSLDDPDSPKTVEALRAAVERRIVRSLGEGGTIDDHDDAVEIDPR